MFDNGWIYFLLSILVFVNILLINYYEKDNKLSVIMLAMYAVVFSMIITLEYLRARPNYYIYLWMIICTIIYLFRIVTNKKVVKIIEISSIFLVVIMCLNELDIYTNIGQVHKERLNAIKEVKEKNLTVLKLKQIDDKYGKYHPDANCPDSKDYWAYKYFVYYYELPENIEIELVE